MRATFLT